MEKKWKEKNKQRRITYKIRALRERRIRQLYVGEKQSGSLVLMYLSRYGNRR